MQKLISKEEIQQAVAKIAKRIDADYKAEGVVLVAVLKGACCLASDLLRAISIPCEIEFIQAKSYGPLGSSRGDLTLLGLDQLQIQGKQVLVVDDIFDSGETLSQIIENLQKKAAKNVRSLVLLRKKISRTVAYEPDYALFDINDDFVVGYGLDYKELYRGLNGIYKLT